MANHSKAKENLVRVMDLEPMSLRSAENGQDGRTLFGHFAVFNEWTEINSVWEGRFLERISPGAFKQTFDQRSDKIKVLYDHGKDPQLGNKPLGSIDVLREDDTGAYYEVSLLDTSYNNDFILPAAKAGLLGASFRFTVNDESWDDAPSRSEYNPEALPERTVTGMNIFEFGPVTFPAYEAASAGVRSATDEFYVHLMRDPHFVARFTDRAGLQVVEKALESAEFETRQSDPGDVAEATVVQHVVDLLKTYLGDESEDSGSGSEDEDAEEMDEQTIFCAAHALIGSLIDDPMMRAADPQKPYGDVTYADPGYQKDGKKRYPIDSAAHVKAAWSYINQAGNASAYSADQVASIKGRIKSAAKKYGIEISDESKSASDDGVDRADLPANDIPNKFNVGDMVTVAGDGMDNGKVSSMSREPAYKITGVLGNQTGDEWHVESELGPMAAESMNAQEPEGEERATEELPEGPSEEKNDGSTDGQASRSTKDSRRHLLRRDYLTLNRVGKV